MSECVRASSSTIFVLSAFEPRFTVNRDDSSRIEHFIFLYELSRPLCRVIYIYNQSHCMSVNYDLLYE